LPDVLDHITVAVVACALLTLTAGRMIPVWISLIGTSTKAPTRIFIGWFGPRGLASVVFGLLLLEETEVTSELGAVGDELFGVIALTVTASVLLHGASAAPGARAYGRWAAKQDDDDDRDKVEMKMVEVAMPRGRWSLRR
jgi:NhaP-type Na+/H+ or K+/H+ antiporter